MLTQNKLTILMFIFQRNSSLRKNKRELMRLKSKKENCKPLMNQLRNNNQQHKKLKTQESKLEMNKSYKIDSTHLALKELRQSLMRKMLNYSESRKLMLKSSMITNETLYNLFKILQRKMIVLRQIYISIFVGLLCALPLDSSGFFQNFSPRNFSLIIFIFS